jgi:hypothetical protein
MLCRIHYKTSKMRCFLSIFMINSRYVFYIRNSIFCSLMISLVVLFNWTRRFNYQWIRFLVICSQLSAILFIFMVFNKGKNLPTCHSLISKYKWLMWNSLFRTHIKCLKMKHVFLPFIKYKKSYRGEKNRRERNKSISFHIKQKIHPY